ncbi:anti-sigma-I factor RsgI family protein [Caldinitratiruptor microaerophilus]|uniref:Anti-sigma factor RsgI-like middle domain-containing protein n=1 Tax=Caldinitratiruptor microaerophilus TaxID=671077 RepID=A0AA35CNL1_9FIRM|nr:hypothetical protein [Caldinitratiruptor microaerophilus]BDG62437.1 hypothetical protein caldi_35270 [Caldinitratiruptor microaerophilus]
MNPTIRGVVLDAGDGTVLLLTDAGELRSVPWSGDPPQVGAVVVGPAGAEAGSGDPGTVPARPAPGARHPVRRVRRVLVAAAAAALVPLAWWLGPGRSRPALPALAVVAVDINPSVELWVGDAGTVLRASPQNPDGERVLTELDLVGLPAPAAAAAVVRRAAELGYLGGPDPAVLVTVVDLKPRNGGAAGGPSLDPAELAGAVEAGLRAGPPGPALVVVQRVPKGVLDAAHRSGLPVGVYTAVERARGLSLPVDPAAVKAGGLRRALAAAGASVGSLYETSAPGGDPQAPLVLRTGAGPAPAPDTGRGDDESSRGDRTPHGSPAAAAPGGAGRRSGNSRAGSPAAPPGAGQASQPGSESTPGSLTPPVGRGEAQEDEPSGLTQGEVPQADEADDSAGGPRDHDGRSPAADPDGPPSRDEAGDEPADELSGGDEARAEPEPDGKKSDTREDSGDEKDSDGGGSHEKDDGDIRSGGGKPSGD